MKKQIGIQWRPFSETAVTKLPLVAGVYVLTVEGGPCLYVGETDNLRRGLLEELCLWARRRPRPDAFGFEVVRQRDQRPERRKELVADFGPVHESRVRLTGSDGQELRG